MSQQIVRHEKKQVKHAFTDAEKAELNIQFRQAVKNKAVIEAEFDKVKASYKARTAEAESQATHLDALLDAGFEMQERDCVLVYAVKEKQKLYFLKSQLGEKGELSDEAEPVLAEPMTEADLQMELVQAEAKFELKDEIVLFPPTTRDMGLLVVGQQGGRWFTALRVTFNDQKITERLDSEQKATKKRFDAVEQAVKRFSKWVADRFGKDAADGFGAGLDSVLAAHRDREE